jgi:hypothetical protein
MRSLAACALAAASLAAILLAGERAGAQAAPTAANVDCAAAFNEAGALREKGSLKAAHARYEVCALPACPSFVALCVSLAEEVRASIPSVVLQAKDELGRPITAVTVTIDGSPLTTGLYGAAVEVDPGKHTFEFRADGYTPTTREMIVVEGKKSQVDTVTLQSVAKAPSPPASPTAAIASRVPPPTPAAAEPPATSGSSRLRKTLGLVTGSAGVAGLAIGSFFGLSAGSKWSAAKRECTPNYCGPDSQAQQDHDAAANAATLSTVFFVAGGVAAVAGAVLWLTAPSAAVSTGVGAPQERSRTQTILRLSPEIGIGGAGFRVDGSWAF